MRKDDMTANVVTSDVTIVGGGLVGSAFALGAAQAGLHVAWVAGRAHESVTPSDEPWDRRVYAISPASRRFLAALKVWPQLDASRIAPVFDMRVLSEAQASGARRGALHFSSYEAGTDALAWIVEHRELARVLETALRYQAQVTRIDADVAARVDATPVDNAGRDPGRDAALAADRDDAPIRFSDDAVSVRAGHSVLRSALLVGADGAHSVVRAAAGIEAHCKSYEQQGVVGNFACTRKHGGVAHQWFLPGEGVAALLPLPGQAVSLVWSAPLDLAGQLLGMCAAQVAEKLAPLAGPVLGALTPLGGLSGFPLSLMSAAQTVAARTALIGDAAHVVHPLAGQGLNLGFQDAAALLDVLHEREPVRDCGDRVLLRRYARRRAEPVAAMRWVTDGLHDLFGSANPAVATVRSAGMNLIDRLPVIKKALVRQAMG